MRARFGLFALVAGCYSPSALPGSPCNPSLANCPEGQSCALVGGSYVCTAGPVSDAGRTDSPILDAPRDAFVGLDASPDAAQARWALIQTAESSNVPTVSLNPSGAGHLIVVGIETSARVLGVMDDAGNTYTEVPMATASTQSAGLGVDMWYAANASAGATTITVSTNSVSSIVIWEASGIRTTSPLDTSASLSDQATTTLPVGAPVTTTAAGDFIVSIAIVANSVSGIHAGNEFTNDRRAKGNGWAHITSTAAPAGAHQAKWDQPTTGVYCTASAAFFAGP